MAADGSAALNPVTVSPIAASSLKQGSNTAILGIAARATLFPLVDVLDGYSADCG
jgi:hypothetical protein